MQRAIAVILLAGGLAGGLAASGCSHRNAGSAGDAGPVTRVHYVVRDTARSWTGDSTRSPEEVSVAFVWPHFTAAPGAAAVDSLNAFVHASLVSPYARAGTYASLDSLMNEFIADYRRYRHDFPAAPSGWYLKRTVDVAGDTAGVACLSVYEESFGGGAHPNAATRLVLFDEHTGRRLGLDDLVSAASRDSLTHLGEAAFRSVRQIPAGQTLTAAGFWFKHDQFALTDNVGISPRGLVFLFNDYEVGPHVMGPTRIELGWDAVRPLLRADGALGALVQRGGPS